MSWFPDMLSRNGVPRVGDRIRVKQDIISHLVSERLPIELEVKSVIWGENLITIEINYNNQTVMSYKQSGKLNILY